MACTENSASESIADFIYRYYVFSPESILQDIDFCYDFVNPQFIVVYQPLSEVEPLSIGKDGYDTIPSLYTLLDSANMDSAGILRTFDQPQLGYKLAL